MMIGDKIDSEFHNKYLFDQKMDSNKKVAEFKSKRPSYFQSDQQQQQQTSTTPYLKHFQDLQPMQLKTRSTTISYEKNDTSFFTSEIRLYQKYKLLQECSSSQHSSEPDDQVKRQLGKNATLRYYKMEQCRRCLRHGHKIRNCTTTLGDICSYCLGKHSKYQCHQMACQHCGQNHLESQNLCDKNISCSECQMWGHSAEYCGVIIKRSRTSSDLQLIKCLCCKQSGHINCGFGFKQDSIYKQFKSSAQKYKQMQKDLVRIRNSYLNIHCSNEYNKK